MTAYQTSERGGAIRVRIMDGRVRLGGKAVTVWQGDII